MYLLRYKSTTIAGAVCRMHSGKAQVAGRISQKSAGHFMKLESTSWEITVSFLR